jgi:hypothetical protein
MVFVYGALVLRFNEFDLESPFTGPFILVVLPAILALIWPLSMAVWLLIRKLNP